MRRRPDIVSDQPPEPSFAPGRPRAIVFDWDNTLVDSWPLIHEAYAATHRALDLPEVSLAELQATAHESLRDRFPRIYGERWQEARSIYLQTFLERHLDRLTPLAGTAAALARLHGAGIYMCLVSNKVGATLRAEVAKLGWEHFFGAMIGSGDAPADKPDIAPVLMALAPGHMAPGSDVWFVGDSIIDLECAHRSGCLPVLVAENSHSNAQTGAFPPRLRLTATHELVSHVGLA